MRAFIPFNLHSKCIPEFMNCEFFRTSSVMIVIQVNFTLYLSVGKNFLNFWFLYMIRRKITFFSLVLLFLPRVTEIILISIRSLLKCINSTDDWNSKLKTDCDR